jgi:hypothetical protein
MFDETTSLPVRAAIASFLGGLFGIGMILFATPAQAQTAPPTQAGAGMSIADDSVAVIRRIGDATLRSLRGAEPVLGIGTPVTQGLRLSIDAHETGSGLRWQVARMQGLRSEGDIPRSRDLISLGVQVRF